MCLSVLLSEIISRCYNLKGHPGISTSLYSDSCYVDTKLCWHCAEGNTSLYFLLHLPTRLRSLKRNTKKDQIGLILRYHLDMHQWFFHLFNLGQVNLCFLYSIIFQYINCYNLATARGTSCCLFWIQDQCCSVKRNSQDHRTKYWV